MKWYEPFCSLLKNFDFDSHYRRKITEIENHQIEKPKTLSGIIANGEVYPIDWNKVKNFGAEGGLELPSNCYRKASGLRHPTMFMAHWDVCLSSKSCYNVLINRNLSVHFLIDNDGTIYQVMDTNDVGFHAGSRKVNNASIGVEISNAFYPKYQTTYIKRGHGMRPIVKDAQVHGKTLEPHLGFYPIQIKAFKALAQALNRIYNIPLVAPMENNQLVETIYNDAKNAKFKGVVSHYHITKRKIDCAGLKLDEVLK